MSQISINLTKIKENYLHLREIAERKGISITPITKVAAGEGLIAKLFQSHGTEMIGDSRIQNIKKFREAGINTKYLLLRSPAPNEVEDTIRYTDFSLNSEPETVLALQQEAQKQDQKHGIVLMLEMGDLREGTTLEKALDMANKIECMSHLYLKGIGANFACYGGVIPSDEKMRKLSELSERFPSVDLISGGNSANISWLLETKDNYKINNLRLGESIFLGVETLYRDRIDHLHTDAFVLSAEVIESGEKRSFPDGETAQDAFGNTPQFKDQGLIQRAILNVGRQDVNPEGLTPLDDGIQILGASSDHLIIKTDTKLKIGEQVNFSPNYSALLRIMTSPYIQKVYLD